MLVSNHAAQPTARFSDYLAIARPDHWIKHVLIIPGVAFAMIMSAAGPLDYLRACGAIAGLPVRGDGAVVGQLHHQRMARCAVRCHASHQALAPGGTDGDVSHHRIRAIYPADVGGYARGQHARRQFQPCRGGVRGVRRDLQCAADPRQGSRLSRCDRRIGQQSVALPVRLVRGHAPCRATGVDPAGLLVRRRVPDGRQARLGTSRHRRGRRHGEPCRLSPVLRGLHAVEPGDELPRLRPGIRVHDGDLPVKIPDRISRRHSAADRVVRGLYAACFDARTRPPRGPRS